MKNFIISLLTISTLLFTSAIFAENIHYAIVVDAGSSGSRLHLFQYDTTNAMPKIQDIFSESTKPGISSYENEPEKAALSLKKLLDDATQELKNKKIDPHTVSVSVLATAGMRLLPEEKQQAIYHQIKNNITHHYAFTLGDVKTISGTLEGIYGWLDVNYLAGHLQNKDNTVGAIDIGGASTQIVFETNDMSRSRDEVTFTLGGKFYRVFSKSFLGLGQNQARDAMNKDILANACYPTGYKTGQFDFVNCSQAYMSVIEKHHVAEEVLPLTQKTFIAFSGAYFTYDFLQTVETPDQVNVENKIQTICTQSWEKLKIMYPTIPEKFLATDCADSVYLDNLFYHTYQLTNSQLKVASKINQQDIDWTLGSLLYQLADK